MKSLRNEKLKILADICGKYNVKPEYNVPMSEYTTFRIGGKAEMLVSANCEQLIGELVIAAMAEQIRYTVLGRGSNVLVSDKGIDGIVIIIGKDFADVSVNGNMITAKSGATLLQVCKAALENSLTGMEFAYGIPGTVGGALVMNAGAFGGEMADVVFACKYLDEAMDTISADVSELCLSYRHSLFTVEPYIVTEVTFLLKEGEKSEIENKMNEILNKRKLKQPLEFASAGSTFKRPENNYASKLIEESGLKGFSIGGAQVSEKHSGFVINRNNASFSDVCAVVDFVKTEVLKKTGIKLECEILIIE